MSSLQLRQLPVAAWRYLASNSPWLTRCIFRLLIIHPSFSELSAIWFFNFTISLRFVDGRPQPPSRIFLYLRSAFPLLLMLLWKFSHMPSWRFSTFLDCLDSHSVRPLILWQERILFVSCSCNCFSISRSSCRKKSKESNSPSHNIFREEIHLPIRAISIFVDFWIWLLNFSFLLWFYTLVHDIAIISLALTISMTGWNPHLFHINFAYPLIRWYIFYNITQLTDQHVCKFILLPCRSCELLDKQKVVIVSSPLFTFLLCCWFFFDLTERTNTSCSVNIRNLHIQYL